MRQHINLVNPALLPPKPFFQFKSMVLALAVLAGGLLLLALVMLPGLNAYEQASLDAQQRLAEKQAWVGKQEKALVVRQKDPQLAAQLESLRAEQLDLQRIDEALQAGGEVAQGQGASAWLYALAQQPLPGAWLTSIEVQANGISLQGMAERAEAIPATLALLERLPAFQGQRFSAFEAGRAILSGSDPARPVEVLGFRLESALKKEQVR